MAIRIFLGIFSFCFFFNFIKKYKSTNVDILISATQLILQWSCGLLSQRTVMAIACEYSPYYYNDMYFNITCAHHLGSRKWVEYLGRHTQCIKNQDQCTIHTINI